MKYVLFAALLLAAPALAQEAPDVAPDVMTFRYVCDRGVVVPATYVITPAGSVAVISVEGRQITLMQEIAASGVRYGWPSGGSHYVWWTKGDYATLFWHESGDEQVMMGCTTQE